MNRIQAITQRASSLLTHRVVFGLLVVVVSLASSQFLDMRNDDAYITYRYARNLMQGQGFVFNPGERVLATTSPFHALVMSGAALVTSNLPVAALLISSLALLALSYYAYLILARSGYRWAGLLAALLIILNIQTFSVFPLETVILSALELGLIYHYLQKRLISAALLGACAVLTRQDAVLLLAVLALHFIVTRREFSTLRRPAIVFSVPVLSWFTFSMAYYGTLIPNTALAKTGFASNGLTFVTGMWPKVLSTLVGNSPVLSALLLLLALVGVWAMFKLRHWDLIILPAWGAVYIAGYSALTLVGAHAWYYYPLAVLVFVSGSHGGAYLHRVLQRAFAPKLSMFSRAVALLFVTALLVVQVKTTFDYSRTHQHSPWTTTREQAYVTVAAWLRANTAPTATVAALEIGTVGYFSDRTIVDLLGLATPAAIPNSRSGDLGRTIVELKPDYVLIQNRTGDALLDDPRAGDLVFAGRTYGDYRPIERFQSEGYDIGLYQRVTAAP